MDNYKVNEITDPKIEEGEIVEINEKNSIVTIDNENYDCNSGLLHSNNVKKNENEKQQQQQDEDRKTVVVREMNNDLIGELKELSSKIDKLITPNTTTEEKKNEEREKRRRERKRITAPESSPLETLQLSKRRKLMLDHVRKSSILKSSSSSPSPSSFKFIKSRLSKSNLKILTDCYKNFNQTQRHFNHMKYLENYKNDIFKANNSTYYIYNYNIDKIKLLVGKNHERCNSLKKQYSVEIIIPNEKQKLFDNSFVPIVISLIEKSTYQNLVECTRSVFDIVHDNANIKYRDDDDDDEYYFDTILKNLDNSCIIDI